MNAQALEKNPIGLAIVGCGRVGRIRGRCAREYPGTEWIGCCDIDEKKGKQLAEDLNADFFTTDYQELLKRPEYRYRYWAKRELRGRDSAAARPRHPALPR